jgi:hypothetical protein
VGQAGIGNIHQVKVSNYRLVPKYSVIAQPQMLFLVLDQQLNRPSFQIVSYNGSHRGAQVISDQCYLFTLSPAAGKNHLNLPQLIQTPESLCQAILSGLTQAGNAVPLAALSQDITAISAELALSRTYLKPPIRLTYADIMPSLLSAGSNYIGAQIKGIKQHRDLKTFGQAGLPDGLGCQFCKLVEGKFQLGSMFFFDVQPAAPGDGHTAIIQAHFQDSVAGCIFASGVMMEFAYPCHLFGSLEGLRIIEDEKQIGVFFLEQAKQHIQSDILHHYGLVPAASPEEFAMIGSVSGASEDFGQFIDSCTVAYGDSHYQSPEVLPWPLGKMLAKGFEKTLEFSWDFADCNHTASPMISFYCYKSYRQSRPFLFDNCHHQNLRNRSV